MEDWRLSTDAGIVNRCAGIHVSDSVQKHCGGLDVAVFGGYVQQRRSLESEVARARNAEVEFGEPAVYQRGVGIELFCQMIEAAAEQVQHRRNGVLCDTSGFEKDINARR